MRKLLTSPFLSVVGLAITLILSSSSQAQRTTDPSSLPKNAFEWNQEQRELGFLHFDEVFKAREVPTGNNVHKLSQGKPIAAFGAGGEKEKELPDFRAFPDQPGHRPPGLLHLPGTGNTGSNRSDAERLFSGFGKHYSKTKRCNK